MVFPTLGRRPDSLHWLGIDFFNTLYRTGLIDGPATANEVFSKFGHELDIDALWPVYRALELEDLTGRISTNEKYAQLLARMHLPYDANLVLALRAAEKRDLTVGGAVLEGAAEFLEWAKSRGIALLLVTNVTEVGTEVQQESGLMSYFDKLATSRHLAAVKSPRERELDLFTAFCWEYDLDVTAGTIVDDEERWLEAAHHAGLCTALQTQAWAPGRVMQPSFMPGILATNFVNLRAELEVLP